MSLRLLISGGSGLLGKELRKCRPDAIAPPRSSLDITDAHSVDRYFDEVRPEIYIHCAAIVGTVRCREDPALTMSVNAGGVLNTVDAAVRHDCRFIYISTEYVFEGHRSESGMFTEEAPVAGMSINARSKIAGEMLASAHPDHLIIRTNFFNRHFMGLGGTPYRGAFIDQFTSRDFVDILAPDYMEAAVSDLQGVIHVGTERKSQFDLMSRVFPDVKPILRADVDASLPIDCSLDTSKWKEFKKQRVSLSGAEGATS